MQDGNCKQTASSRSGNTMKFRFECSGQHKASGEGEVTFVSSKEHKGKVMLTSTRGTREETMEMEMEMESAARWVAVDCGDIKPRP